MLGCWFYYVKAEMVWTTTEDDSGKPQNTLEPEDSVRLIKPSNHEEMEEEKTMNEVAVFENEQFGTVRTVFVENEPWFVATDVCRALEIRNNRDALKRLDDDEKMTVALTDSHSGQRGGAQSMTVVNEPGLYSLVLGSRKPEAKVFKRWITHEVIPSIRKTGSYSVKLSPAELLVEQAKVLLEQEKRISYVEERVKKLEAKTATRPEAYFTIAGYANLHGIRLTLGESNVLGKRASKLSRVREYKIDKVSDQRYGTVNSYHTDILEAVFENIYSCED